VYVGRNLASTMIITIIASMFDRYYIEQEYEGQKVRERRQSFRAGVYRWRQPAIKEGLLRKPMHCVLGIKRRETSLPEV
jgi:hypothetical protein